MATLDEEQTERALKAMLAVNARQEQRINELIMKKTADPPAPEVIRKLELDLDKDGKDKVVRVLKGVVVCLEQSRETHLRSGRKTRAEDCEARRLETVVLLRMLGAS